MAKVLHERSHAYLMEFWVWKPSRGEWRPMVTSRESYETAEDAEAAARRFMTDLYAEPFDGQQIAAREDTGWATMVLLARARMEGLKGGG